MKVAGIVLAAGRASRMGRPKVDLKLEGRPLVRWAVDALAGAGVHPVLVVAGPDTPDLAAALSGSPARLVHNPRAREGMSTSVQAGLAALPPQTAAVLVCLGDQPGVTAEVVAALVARYAQDQPAVVVPSYRGFWGNPALLDRGVWPEVMALAGDTGARPVIMRRPERVVAVEFDRDPPPDIDTPEAYRRLVDG